MGSVKNSKISDKAFTKQYGPETVWSYGCDPHGSWEISAEINSFDGENPQKVVAAPKCEVYVYRMTQVNEDGDVVELSPDQMRMRCEQMGVKTVPVFERFIIPKTRLEIQCHEDGSENLFNVDVDPGEYVLRKVEEYFDGPDPIGKTHVREGVVARIVNRPNIAVYKHKNFSFKVLEGIAKDEAVAPDMEEAQEETAE
jgi:hypothetical protein